MKAVWIAALTSLLAVPVAADPPPAAPLSAADVSLRAPPAPDYSKLEMWSQAGSAVAPGATAVARTASVDVFYIYPTTLRSAVQLNADPANSETNRWVDESAIARQASVFNGCCRVFAPRYRAASYLALMSPAVRDQAFALAYFDVERAFDWYLAHENHGRPFIIAGHSQGAFHAATLLEKRIDGTALQRQLVAAYIIGINLAEGEFGKRFHAVQPCDRPKQTGCVIQWEAVSAGGDVGKIAAYAQSTYVARYGDDPGKVSLCINPLTFDRRKPSAPARASQGAAPGSPGFGQLRPLVRGKVAARCEQGLLVVEADPTLDLQPLPGGSLHYHDFGLFYADVRADAARRTAAFWLNKP